MPPYVIGSATSQAAAASMERIAENLREECFNFIQDQGKSGAISDEVEKALNLVHQTCSARVYELAKDKRIIKTAVKRPTRSGRKAFVYVAREFA